MSAEGQISQFDYAAIDARLLCINAPRMAETRHAVESIKDAGAAWETLLDKGFVPVSFAAPNQRYFAGMRGARWIESAHPLTRDDAACVAAAVNAMIAVEELARRIIVALEPWGQPAPRKVVWNVLPTGKLKQSAIRGAHAVCDAMNLAAIHAGQASVGDGYPNWTEAAKLSVQPGRNAAQRIFAHDVSMHESWTRAIRAKACVPWGPYFHRLDSTTRQYAPVCIPRALVGRSFTDLADPISPLLAIWDAGCALDTITEERVLLHLPHPIVR